MNFPKIEKRDIPDEITVRRVAHRIKIGDEISIPDPLSEDYKMMTCAIRTIEYDEDSNIIRFNPCDDDVFFAAVNEMVELISGSLAEE